MATLVLFDVDGTLTPSRQGAPPEVLRMLRELRGKVKVGVVSGSDFPKIVEQMGKDVLDIVDYTFLENGLVAYSGRELIHRQSIRDRITDNQLKEFVNFVLRYIADLDIPVKTGTFIELRTGVINVSPIGRNCTSEERARFFQEDKVAGWRVRMAETLCERFGSFGLQVSIGGQISLDVFPVGWTKTYCLRHVESAFKTIHFFGDRTEEGGNDHEIFVDPRVVGHTVTSVEDTIDQCQRLFLA